MHCPCPSQMTYFETRADAREHTPSLTHRSGVGNLGLLIHLAAHRPLLLLGRGHGAVALIVDRFRVADAARALG